MDVDETMQKLISSGAGVQDMRQHARACGARFLRDDGLVKAWQGITSVEEVMRVTST